MVSTLASEVAIERPISTHRFQDVLVEVDQTIGNGAVIQIARPTMTITIDLSGAERIALIEALGGHV